MSLPFKTTPTLYDRDFAAWAERQALLLNQTKFRGATWRVEIIKNRRCCKQILQDSPNVKPYLEEVFAQCYRDAVEQASAETELPVDTFPIECPYPLTEVLQSGFLPQDESEEEE
ncbi:MAG: DUF29 domain-containing protein [Cyanosarcina radialis HA8281-LM2]|jgi:hypothetical protein|nr:DUF29 domain-containing protein [Cyanosarcina radialis HA8281-LM2]